MGQMIIHNGVRYRLEDAPLAATYKRLGPLGVPNVEVPQLKKTPTTGAKRKTSKTK